MGMNRQMGKERTAVMNTTHCISSSPTVHDFEVCTSAVLSEIDEPKAKALAVFI